MPFGLDHRGHPSPPPSRVSLALQPRWDSHFSRDAYFGRSLYADQPAGTSLLYVHVPCGCAGRRCPASAWASTSMAPPHAAARERLGPHPGGHGGFSTLTRAWTTAPGRSSTSAVRGALTPPPTRLTAHASASALSLCPPQRHHTVPRSEVGLSSLISP